MKKIVLGIEGMSCSACSNGLEKYINKQEGIISCNVNLVMATASIEYDDKLNIKDLNRFVKEAGFKSTGEAKLDKENKKTSKWPFIVFGLLAFLLMYASMGHMLNLPTISLLDMMNNPTSYAACLLIMTLPFLIYGFDILQSGIKNLIHKMPNMDTLVGIGVISSFLYSLYGVFRVLNGDVMYVENLYFESVAFVIYFIKLGRFIDKSSKEKTKEAIKKLVLITPKTAKIKKDNTVLEVTIDEVKKDDILVCLPGERIAVDGVITLGKSHFDESFITGESRAMEKGIGDKVIAGSINYDEAIEYKAVRIGKDSTISEIVQLVVEATNTKAPIAKQADKISSYFVPIIIGIAVITFVLRLVFTNDIPSALNAFVTVLVVACPCALGLATPLAIVVAEGVCAKRGIFVKKSEILEIASKIDTVVFDKTGTLTEGNLLISKLYNYSRMSDEKLFEIIGSIEAKSTHPIAKGITNYINKKGIKINDKFKVENLSGYGVKGTYNNKSYYVCNSKLLDKLQIINTYKEDEASLTKLGNSVAYIVENQIIIGLVGIKDVVREEACRTIELLESAGIEVMMLTGDNSVTANLIGKELGLKNIKSDVLPNTKAEIIDALKSSGKKVMMVGDGINDAISITKADIGVSMSSASDIAVDSSDVILMNSNLNKILELIMISKKTLRNIKQNLFWAFIYNLSMVPIAAGVFVRFGIVINPMIACGAMIISSLFVVFNALRLKTIKFD